MDSQTWGTRPQSHCGTSRNLTLEDTVGNELLCHMLYKVKGDLVVQSAGDLWEPSIVELDGNQTMRELTCGEEVNDIGSQ